MRARAILLLTAAVAASGLAGVQADTAATVSVRLEPGGLARAGVRAAWSASYGSFDWAEISASDVRDLRAAGVRAELRPDAHTLVLPQVSFDPLKGLPSVNAARWHAGEPALHLIQLRGPSKDAWLAAIRERGARIVQYMAPFAYVAMLDPADANAVRRLSFVRWVGPFEPAYRFDLAELASARRVGALAIDGGQAASSVSRLRALGLDLSTTNRLPFADLDAVGLLLEAPTVAELRAVAELPNLYSLSPDVKGKLRSELSSQINAGNYDAQGQPQLGYQSWLTSKGVTGSGVVIAHVDDGFSTAHPDTVGQVAGCRNYSVPGHTCRAETGVHSDFHGQHTGGIIVGSGTVPGVDAQGALGQGVAPGAKLFVQNYIGLTATEGYSGPGQYVELNRDSALGGATVSANSWGPSGSPRGYDAATREFDQAPRDANPSTPEHEPLGFVLSIMNGNGGTSTQGTPDEGKNLLRVGSSKDARAGDIDWLGNTSAHGPALDGRRLPDVVAPGEAVVSTANPATVALCLDPVVHPGAALYSGCNGTSMASPHVSGASALFIEHYRKAFANKTPSPALTKGAIVNGAVDLAGGRDADGGALGHIPDNKQGWGRVNMGNVLGGTEKLYLDQSVVLGDTGQSHALKVAAADPAKPVKITLTWTDALGHGMGGATPAWVNDLDLRVSTGPAESPTTFLGNAFGSPSTGWSVPGGAADFRNNLENVYLQEAPAGEITIEILAANVAGDGIPGNEDSSDQDFALVVSNGRTV